MICSLCGLDKPKLNGGLRGKEPYVKTRFVDERGEAWHGTACPSCRRMKHKAWTRKKCGREGRFDSPRGHHAKATWGEKLAAALFEREGYSVKMTERYGPDLFLTKGNTTLTCEVKTVTHSKNGTTLYCGEVMPKRKADDLVAIVFSPEIILVEPMEVHLARCGKNGKRNLTQEAKFFGV